MYERQVACVLEGSKRLGRAQSFDHCDDPGARTTGNHIGKRSHRQKHDAASTDALTKSDTSVKSPLLLVIMYYNDQTSCGAKAQQTPPPCCASRGFSELTKNVIRSSHHGHSTPSLKISCKSVLPFCRNLADKETNKERNKQRNRSKTIPRPRYYRA